MYMPYLSCFQVVKILKVCGELKGEHWRLIVEGKEKVYGGHKQLTKYMESR